MAELWKILFLEAQAMEDAKTIILYFHMFPSHVSERKWKHMARTNFKMYPDWVLTNKSLPKTSFMLKYFQPELLLKGSSSWRAPQTMI